MADTCFGTTSLKPFCRRAVGVEGEATERSSESSREIAESAVDPSPALPRERPAEFPFVIANFETFLLFVGGPAGSKPACGDVELVEGESDREFRGTDVLVESRPGVDRGGSGSALRP